MVLKGLLNTGDADALAATIGEQRFLARVEHPLIVEIYNFVTHDDAGYIVMEYVGGRSLKQLLKQRMTTNNGVADPLPVEQALAFLIEILPALGYLHELGLLYCDFKPDNVIQVGDSLKLIDLGGVRHIGDEDSAIYGTVGYQAPEVATLGPSIASDIFTVGRTLLVLCAEVPGYQSEFEFRIPPAEDIPALAAHDSLYRLLLKCCAADPNDRFTSAEELRLQMLGVLREVVATATAGVATTAASSALFEAPTVATERYGMRQLPRLRMDPSDPQAGWLARVSVVDPVQRLAALDAPPGMSAEVLLARGDAALEANNRKLADDCVRQLLLNDPWEWRAVWLAGLNALQGRDFATAQSSFNAVYGQVPGELAPKLALALACELGGELDIAESLYRTCASTDASYVTPAAFGLARVRAARNDLPGSLAALELVPNTSRGYLESQRLRARHLVSLAVTPDADDRGLQGPRPGTPGAGTRGRVPGDPLPACDGDGGQGEREAVRADDDRVDAPRPAGGLLPRTRPPHRRPGCAGRLCRPCQHPASLEPAVSTEWPLWSGSTPRRACSRAAGSSAFRRQLRSRRARPAAVRSTRRQRSARPAATRWYPRARSTTVPDLGRLLHPDQASRRACQRAVRLSGVRRQRRRRRLLPDLRGQGPERARPLHVRTRAVGRRGLRPRRPALRATRTRWRCGQRATAPSSWSVTGCRAVSTPTSPRSPVRRRPATSWPSLGSDGIGGDDSEDTAVASALVTATEEANKAVIAHTAPDSTNAASATFAAAVVLNDRVHYANLGDSRVYLLTPTREAAAEPRRLDGAGVHRRGHAAGGGRVAAPRARDHQVAGPRRDRHRAPAPDTSR